MKKILLLLSVVLFFVSCISNHKKRRYRENPRFPFKLPGRSSVKERINLKLFYRFCDDELSLVSRMMGGFVYVNGFTLDYIKVQGNAVPDKLRFLREGPRGVNRCRNIGEFNVFTGTKLPYVDPLTGLEQKTHDKEIRTKKKNGIKSVSYGGIFVDKDDKKIIDLNFLNKFKDAEHLRLHRYKDELFLLDNPIKNISYIDFPVDNQEDLDILKKFPNVKVLHLRIDKDNFDYNVLTSLKKLEILHVKSNFRLGNIPEKVLTINTDEFPKLSSVKELKIRGFNLSDKLLKKFPSVTKLHINFNNLKDISFLKDFTNLTTLSLDYNKIEDISILKDFKNLTHLYLGVNKIKDVTCLNNLTNLKELTLQENPISDLDDIRKLSFIDNLIYYK